MDYFFITGTGKGLGRSVAEALLKLENTMVYGMSRHNSISHKRFNFISLDLLDHELLMQFAFPELVKAESVFLINNAGVIGEVNPIGAKNEKNILQTFQVNTIAPCLLMNAFVNKYQSLNVQKAVINISSGAARHAINAWLDYCASKAALDSYSLVLAEEQKLEPFPFKVSSVAPGIIDTEMQNEIRATDPKGFPKHKYFVDLKNNNDLSAPSDIAKALLKYIKEPQYDKVLVDLREL